MDTLLALALISGCSSFLACFFLGRLLEPRRKERERLADCLFVGLAAGAFVAFLALPWLG